MHELIAAHQSELAELSRRYGVVRLDLFGSMASGQDQPTSDVDFVVEFADASPSQMAEAYFGLLESMTQLLGRDVDLVTTDSVTNPYFLDRIQQTRQPVYVA